MEEYKKLKENFIKTLPRDEKDNEELIKSFDLFLSNMTSQLKEFAFQHQTNPDFLGEIVISRANDVTNLSFDAKRAYLIEDPMLDRLRNISNEIYEKAVQKAEGKKIEFSGEKYESTKSEIKDTLKQVKPYNLDEAKNICSELLLDIEYLSGKDIASLRIGHIIRENREKEK